MRETCTSGSMRGWRAADSNPLLVALLYRLSAAIPFWHCEQFKTPKEDWPLINADERR